MDDRWKELSKATRPLNAAKNLLVFVPLLASHGPFTASALRAGLGVLLAFTATASGVYLLNDVLDARADRSHPAKQQRAIAARRLAPSIAVVAASALFAAGAFVLFAFRVPTSAALVLALYLALALLYATVLKRLLLLDVFVLSGLNLARILAGGAATATRISPWLMALSGFLFLSLAFLKRYAELNVRSLAEDETVPGRAYRRGDLPLLGTAGVTSGYVAVLVLALYVNGRQADELYARPELLWLACPALLYWITRLWVLASRGRIEDDPLVAALKDPVAYAVGAWVVVVALLAT